MGDMGRSAGLRTIFSFFLGLMLTVFVGIGVYTFHPPPKQFDNQIRDLEHREQGIRSSGPSSELSGEDRDQLREISSQRRDLADAAAEARKPWGISTSIILIMFSTAALVVSLVRADQLLVISNGLLLGGVFTMLYGVGWVVATDTSITRFLVMTVALVITVGLGYARFVHRVTTSSLASGSAIPTVEGLEDVELRVCDLEKRMNGAANALGKKSDE
ncbi:MAG: hypothetical protein KOO60_02830 [Gemmatimonadales bacterium]|nr:hypothetical protein [Gemmatimonadales bacterium]